MAYQTINWEDYPSTKTPVTSQNLRHMDNQIKKNAEEIEEIKKEKTYRMFGVLSAGDTSIVFRNSNITGNGTYQVNPSKYGVTPIDMTATAGAIECTYNPQDEDVNLELRYWESGD